MIPIYLCDDEIAVLNELRRIIRDHIAEKKYDMETVYAFSSPDELLNSLKQGIQGAVYFLDVDLKHPEYDGFSLGEQIRKFDPTGFIIYITAFSDFAFKTFQYHIEAMDYIVKGESYKMRLDVIRCLDTVAMRSKAEKDKITKEQYAIKVDGGIKHVLVDDIYLFETSPTAHHIMLYAENEVIDFLGSIQEIEKSVTGRFMRVHRSYLVNLEKIDYFDSKKSQLILKNGCCCFVARKMKSPLRKAIKEDGNSSTKYI